MEKGNNDNNANDTSGVGLADIGSAQQTSTSANTNSNNDTLMGWSQRIEHSIAQCRHVRGSNYVQLATVDTTAVDSPQPRCRTVVFRGFLSTNTTENSTSSTSTTTTYFQMITDRRSRKVHEQQQRQPYTAELVWWFPLSSEQYRVRGNLLFVGKDKNTSTELLTTARQTMWNRLRPAAKEQFYWTNESGSLRDLNVESEEVPSNCTETSANSDVSTSTVPPDTFLLMLLEPKRVDYLRLTDNYRQIDTLLGPEDSWEQQPVHP